MSMFLLNSNMQIQANIYCYIIYFICVMKLSKSLCYIT